MRTITRLAGWICGSLALLLIGASAGVAANVVTLKNKSTVQAKPGGIEWRESAKEYRVLTPDGVTMPVPLAQVERVEVDKPAEFDKVVQMVGAKQYDAAIPILDDLIQKYRMLGWDVRARELLARAYLAKPDGKKLVATLRPLIEGDAKREVPPEVRVMYWKGLMLDKQVATLRTELEDAIATGSRELAALAQIQRGDLSRSEGKKEEALMDYLRTVILFEQVKAAQPEALSKAAELMDELRDARGEELRKKLVSGYPDSPEARKLSGKI